MTWCSSGVNCPKCREIGCLMAGMNLVSKEFCLVVNFDYYVSTSDTRTYDVRIDPNFIGPCVPPLTPVGESFLYSCEPHLNIYYVIAIKKDDPYKLYGAWVTAESEPVALVKAAREFSLVSNFEAYEWQIVMTRQLNIKVEKEK